LSWPRSAPTKDGIFVGNDLTWEELARLVGSVVER